MKYSFLSEAETIDLGNGEFNWKNFKKLFGVRKDIANAAQKSKKLKGLKTVALSANAGYFYYKAVMNALMAKKINSIIKTLESSNISRNRAARLFVELRYQKDDILSTDKGRIINVSYILSEKIAGPAISMITNQSDPNWKQTVITYLKKKRMFLLVKSGYQPVVGTLSGIKAYKVLRK